nr:AAA family ATPase [uncultured Pedobacter sp.]
MARISIRNIGPINSVDLNLNRINVLMGPQSSGKSTIAKIVSFCQWAEKRYILDGSKFEYEMKEMLLGFHKISEAYFSKDSSFEYESDFLKINQSGLKFSLRFRSKKKNREYQKSKNIYIPAERNFVSAIPNLGKYNETNDNIMSFLYDWFDAKKNYQEANPLAILNLGIEYAFDKEIDQLTLLKSKKKLHLKDASSGIQSITPLYMLVDYLTDWFYRESRVNSVNEREEIIKSIVEHYVTKANIISDGPYLEHFQPKSEVILSDREIAQMLKQVENWTKYFFTNFIIEEPEQNLFPTTQRDFVYFLFDRMVNSSRPHSLLITTHSPFILYAINNCLMGKRVSEDMPGDEQIELPSHRSWISSDLVSIWQIHNGEIKSVLDERTGTVTKHYFNEIMNELLEEYYDMLNYFKNDRPVQG